jgi:hypothetical protein
MLRYWCVDAFSKFVWMMPLHQATTAATIQALKTNVFASFSVPEILISDIAQCFVAQFKQFCFGLRIKHVTTSYYPQPSHEERFNRNIRAALIAYHGDEHATWDKKLGWLQLAFNTAEHESTRSPHFATIFPFRSGSP